MKIKKIFAGEYQTIILTGIELFYILFKIIRKWIIFIWI